MFIPLDSQYATAYPVLKLNFSTKKTNPIITYGSHTTKPKFKNNKNAIKYLNNCNSNTALCEKK